MNVTQRILISGGTGFIGRHLVSMLHEQGHSITVWGRDHTKIRRLFGAKVHAITHLNDVNTPQDIIINLAGASIGEHRWTAKNKQMFLDSRLKTTQALYQWATQQSTPPRLINASAIGFYGIDSHLQWQHVCDEDSPAQNVFMSQLCSQWEDAANVFHNLGVQVVKLRFGVVLGQGGGVLPQMIKPLKYAKIGILASGKQPFVWVHINDVLGVVQWLLQQTHWQNDVYNVVAPQVGTQADFVRAATQVLQRSAPIGVPACLMRLAMGEQSDLVLNGQKVFPKNLIQQHYVFQYPDLTSALNHLLKS